MKKEEQLTEAEREAAKQVLARLGRNVKRLRNDLGLNQMQFAEMVHISWTFLSDIELGHKWVSVSTLSMIAQAGQVDVMDLFRKDKEEVSPDNAGLVLTYIDRVNHSLEAQLPDAVKTMTEKMLKETAENVRHYYEKQADSKTKTDTDTKQ
jgi:transcriptional regulator with XRE-family HTH domain